MKPHSQARNQEDEERPPLPFLKIEKSVPIFERGPDMSIFGLNFPLKL